MGFNCSYCGSHRYIVTKTYKHRWITCVKCESVHRERRSRYTFDNWLFRFLIRKIPKLNLIYGETLLPLQKVIEDEKHFYDYYSETARIGLKGTKWEGVVQGVYDNLKGYGIEIKDKSVLDVSGGPGFLTASLEQHTKKAVLTEFSQYAVDGMKKALNIEAVKFDYNTDQIDQCVENKFDIVFIIYSIGFCNDLKEFTISLKKVLHNDSIVYICHSPPTLGLMMRWQFDEYTYTRCWPIQSLVKSFEEIGMKEIHRDDEGSFRYDEDWYTGRKRNIIAKLLLRVHRVIGKKYLKMALNKRTSLNSELVQKNIRHVFKFEE